jgi:hypothetical protein
MFGHNIAMNELDISIVAHKVLQSFIRDRSIFANYSNLYDNRFLKDFRAKVIAMEHLDPIDKLDGDVELKRQKITDYLSHYRPVLNITEALLIRSIDENGLNAEISEFYLSQLRDCVRKRKVWETLRFTRLINQKITNHLDELSDKEIFLRIIDDFTVFSINLRRAELEYAEAVHKRDMASIEHALAREQMQDLLESIFESSSKIFSATEWQKLDEYSIEKIMAEVQFRRMLPH